MSKEIEDKCKNGHKFTKIDPKTGGKGCEDCDCVGCNHCDNEATQFCEGINYCEDHYQSVCLTKCSECKKDTPFCYGCGSKRGACNDVVCKDCLAKRAKK